MTTYNITLDIEHLPEGPYLGTNPDLPGLIVQADTPEEVIRILITDDHALFREDLAALLKSITDLKVVGETAGGE